MSGLLSSLIVKARSTEAEKNHAAGDRDVLAGVALVRRRVHAELTRALRLAYPEPANTQANVEAGKIVLRSIAEGRAQRRDTLPSPKTLALYERMRRRVEEAMEDQTGDSKARVQKVLGGLGRNAQTFGLYRAALRQGAVESLQTSIDTLALIKTDMLGIRVRLTDDLRRALAWVAITLKLEHQDCLAAAGTTQLMPKSKSGMLKFLPDDWRERVAVEASKSETYGLPCALLDLCGLRPIELEKGVEVEVSGDRVRLRILGGKVREHAGQPWRELEAGFHDLPDWVRARLPAKGVVIVSADPDNMRGWLADVSERLFPRHQPPRKSDVLISAYVYRHAIVTDMRDGGWTSDEIAAVIGESSAETVAWYGLKNVGGRAGRAKKPRAIRFDRSAVQTARDVKPRDNRGSPEAVRKRSNGPK